MQRHHYALALEALVGQHAVVVCRQDMQQLEAHACAPYREVVSLVIGLDRPK